MNDKRKYHQRNSRFLSPLIAFLFLYTSVFLMIGCEKESAPAPVVSSQTKPRLEKLPTEPVAIGGEKFILELAYQRPARTRGLMFRESLGENEGMLFVFQRPMDRSFWMKNCLMDLDILFLGRDGTIINIERMTVPEPDKPLMHYYSDGPAQYAIELAAGTAERLGLKTGDTINFPFRIGRIIPDPD